MLLQYVERNEEFLADTTINRTRNPNLRSSVIEVKPLKDMDHELTYTDSSYFVSYLRTALSFHGPEDNFQVREGEYLQIVDDRDNKPKDLELLREAWTEHAALLRQVEEVA